MTRRAKTAITDKEEIESFFSGIECNSYNRFCVFLDNRERFKENYGYALRVAYESSDNLFTQREMVRIAWTSPRVTKESVMYPEEIQLLADLPETLIIYRGMCESEYKSGVYGLSWTLIKGIAEYFAFTYLRNHSTSNETKVVHQIQIEKKDIIALINDRQEFEIIYAGPIKRFYL